RIAVGQDTTTIAGSAPGTAGTPSANVVTVQGASSMTALKGDPSGVRSPVSLASGPMPTRAATADNQTVNDAANTAKVAAASTAPAAADKALNVALSPNSAAQVEWV